MYIKHGCIEVYEYIGNIDISVRPKFMEMLAKNLKKNDKISKNTYIKCWIHTLSVKLFCKCNWDKHN